MENTLAIIKPDAYKKGASGKIIDRIIEEGFEIVGMKSTVLTKVKAEGFYEIHKDKPFFNELTEFMSSGKCILLALKRENAVNKWREVIGATNPEDADSGTIRKLFGSNTGNNAVHGSDSKENGNIEISYFFNENELFEEN
tara:strand:- start:5281 stop:5703 length:423 start_codon:yes stop_codon:yes gene_type:complete